MTKSLNPQDVSRELGTLQRTIRRLVTLSRPQKRAIQIVADLFLMAGSFLLAMFLRLESWSRAFDPESWLALALLLPVSIYIFARLGFYRAVIRYVSGRIFSTIALGVAITGLMLFALSQLSGLYLPRSVPFMFTVIAFVSLGSVRLMMREVYRSQMGRGRKRVLIYGAGEAGRQLLNSLVSMLEYAPLGFIDDDPALHRATIGGLRVYRADEIEALVLRARIDTILLALPSAPRSRRAEIIARLEPLGVQIQTIPSLDEVLARGSDPAKITEVAIEDLLGRDPVPPKEELMDANILGKTVLVTGAGGSIGSELCRQILGQGVRRLVLLDVSEFALYAIERELRELAEDGPFGPDIVAIMGNVRDGRRLAQIMERFRVDTVFHAAAYKHVPLVEHNMVEGVRNNVFGTLEVAKAARDSGVAAFILVSTDKAVRPTNVMGATKRLAELACQALSHEGGATRFSIVRFGNVLGSSGSVIPLFRKQIRAGGPVTVTHPEVTRYFMTIPEAAQLVIQAGALAQGGEVFVLDMGPPVRIADLASRMVRLSGLTPRVHPDTAGDGEIEIRFTELRPGEKLYEELLVGGEAHGSDHPRIFYAHEIFLKWAELRRHLDALDAACAANDLARVRQTLIEAPLKYAPGAKIVDLTGGAASADLQRALRLAEASGNARASS